jgi:hypothetical protein
MQRFVNESGYQIKADNDGMVFEVEVSPYGDSGVTYNGIAEFVQHWILQLEHFRPQWLNDPKHLGWIDRDIAGYKELLGTGDENVRLFIKMKKEARHPDNLAIVEAMKAAGCWKPVKP